MALNPFFLHGSTSEQRLVQDLINEQLRMYGVEVVYIPRKIVNRDEILAEVQSSKFDNAYIIEAYLNTYEGHTGGGDILSKFGMQLKDEINLVISRERYEEYIGAFIQDEDPYEIEVALRPREGDVIYFPLSERFFEVKFVEHEKPFYQLGKGYTYELNCELFEYENEVLDVGIPEVDRALENVGEIISLKMVGYGQTAAIGADINTGYVRKVYLNNDGYNYTSTPTVTFEAAPSYGRSARGVAITTSIGGVRSLKEIILIDAGYGYRHTPTVTISGGGGVGAAATCSIELYRKGVSRGVVINRGEGYTEIPSVTFSGPTFTGAAATTVIINNAVDRVSMTDGGTNYSTKLAIGVTFSSPNPVGFVTGAISAVAANDQLSTVSITNAGIGHSIPPTLTFSAPTGAAATATATAVGGSLYGEQVSSVSIASSGRYYLSAPTVTFDNPTGIASTATANTTLSSSGGISTFSYTLQSGGRYYLAPPTLTIDFLSLSSGYIADSYFGTNAWKVVNADLDRNITHPGTASTTAIGYSGSIQLAAKIPSSLPGLSTFISFNKLSNGSKSTQVDLRVNDDGYIEVGLGTDKVGVNTNALTYDYTGLDVRDDQWHWIYINSTILPNFTQRLELQVDGGLPVDTFFSAGGGEIQIVTGADVTPPVIENDLNSGIIVDGIFGTVDAGTASSTAPGSMPTADSNTILFDDFENDAIGNLNSISIGCSISNGVVTSIDNSSTTLSGIITSIVSAVIDPPIGTPSNFVATGVASVTAGIVTDISLDYAGYGYATSPGVTLSAPTGVATQFTATAHGKINGDGKLSEIEITDRGLGYISNPTVSISAPLGQTPEGYGNVGVAGTIISVTLTKTGVGYTEPSIVSISNTVTDRDFATGFTTATGTVTLNELDNRIDHIKITDPGSGYLTPPTVTVGDAPIAAGIGTYWFNEVITGSTSGATARVKRWDGEEGILQISIENGTFLDGERVVGSSSSAIYVVDYYINKRDVPKIASVENIDDYEQNDEIEFEADQILDFTEKNPFGNY